MYFADCIILVSSMGPRALQNVCLHLVWNVSVSSVCFTDKKRMFSRAEKVRGLLTCEVLWERGIEYVYLSVLTNSVDHALYVLLRVF